MKKITYKTEMKKVQTIEKEEYFCDKCGCPIITKDYYNRNRYKIEFREGDSYPEGGYYEYDAAYFCKKCSIEVKDILVKNGVKFYNRVLDF